MDESKNKIVVPEDIFKLVLDHFNGDRNKTWEWFGTKNPTFAYKSPLKMLKEKKIKQVLRFALEQLNFKF